MVRPESLPDHFVSEEDAPVVNVPRKTRRLAAIPMSQLAEMLKALEFYADPATYEQATPTTGPFPAGSPLPIHGDLGARARAALDETHQREADHGR